MNRYISYVDMSSGKRYIFYSCSPTSTKKCVHEKPWEHELHAVMISTLTVCVQRYVFQYIYSMTT